MVAVLARGFRCLEAGSITENYFNVWLPGEIDPHYRACHGYVIDESARSFPCLVVQAHGAVPQKDFRMFPGLVADNARSLP